MAVEGVDYAFSQPSTAALVAAGKRFACRYGGPGSAGKQLDAAELAALSAAGIAVVANAEGAADGLKGGYAAGRSWAADADQYFRALGMPADRPIYLSVDFDASSSHWPALDAAMDGAASVLGRDRVGVYGGYRVIAHFASMKDRLATWYWQTYAWSAGRWHPAAHIQQYRNGVTIGGADCDLNRAMVSDYGQWTTGDDDDMTPADQFRLWVDTYRLDSIAQLRPATVVPPFTAADGSVYKGFTEPNKLGLWTLAQTQSDAEIEDLVRQSLQAISDDQSQPVTLTPADIALMSKNVVDGVTTAIDVPTAQENAEAVLDEQHARDAE
jgi:hypothetical protein